MFGLLGLPWITQSWTFLLHHLFWQFISVPLLHKRGLVCDGPFCSGGLHYCQQDRWIRISQRVLQMPFPRTTISLNLMANGIDLSTVARWRAMSKNDVFLKHVMPTMIKRERSASKMTIGALLNAVHLSCKTTSKKLWLIYDFPMTLHPKFSIFHGDLTTHPCYQQLHEGMLWFITVEMLGQTNADFSQLALPKLGVHQAKAPQY